MQSKLTRRAILAGAPAVAAVAFLPAIPALAAPQHSPEQKDPYKLWCEYGPTIFAWRAEKERWREVRHERRRRRTGRCR